MLPDDSLSRSEVRDSAATRAGRVRRRARDRVRSRTMSRPRRTRDRWSRRADARGVPDWASLKSGRPPLAEPESKRHENEASASAHSPPRRAACQCKKRDRLRGANRMGNRVTGASTADERRVWLKRHEREGRSRGPSGTGRSNRLVVAHSERSVEVVRVEVVRSSLDLHAGM
jgi:hypothetical protein